ncbi:hypothetical protein [Methanosphaera sp.]
MKNPITAAILSFFSGIGNLYLGLYTRFAITVILGIVLGYIGTFNANVAGFTFVMYIYFAYDSYLVTNALNNDQDIPKLFALIPAY